MFSEWRFKKTVPGGVDLTNGFQMITKSPQSVTGGVDLTNGFQKMTKSPQSVSGGVDLTNGFQKMTKYPQFYVREMEIEKYRASSTTILCADGYAISNQ